MTENAEERAELTSIIEMRCTYFNGFKVGKVLIHIVEDKPPLLPAFHHGWTANKEREGKTNGWLVGYLLLSQGSPHSVSGGNQCACILKCRDLRRASG